MINNTAIANPIAVLKDTASHKGMAPNIKNTFVPAQQIVFIDQVEDYQLLAAGVVPGIEVVVLESDRNGIEQITEVLSQRTDISTIHLVSHGSPGCLYLGNSSLSLDTLNQYEEKLRSWFNLTKDSISAPLAPQNWGRKNEKSPKIGGFRGLTSVSNPTLHSLLIYGCNVAAGDAGEEFITKLHNITGAKIAASTTRTGNAALGGDWNLEIQIGEILTKTAFTPQVLADYQGILNPPTSPLNLAEQSSKYSVGLKPASALLSQHLATWFSQEDFLTQAAIPFSATAGSSTWTDNALALQDSILNDTYSIRLEVRSASEMEGALGAYSSTGTTNEATIYLNGDWLKTASSESVSSVLLEELGHDFDRRLNNETDSQGDEGQLFASMVSDRVLSAEEQASIASEDDSGLLEIDGQDVAVEFATVNINNGNLNFSTPVSKVGNGTAQGDITLYTGVYTGVDAIVTTTKVDSGITIQNLDSTATDANSLGNQARFFSPQLKGTTAANGTGAAFNIQFIETGSYNGTTRTGIPTTLQNVKLNSYDIDIKQYQTFGVFNAASLIVGGQLDYTTNTTSGLTTFFSNSTTNLTGDVTTTQDGRLQATYNEVSSIDLSMGSNDYSQVTGLAYFFLEFGQGQPWTPTTIYPPVIDLNGTAITGINYSNSFTEKSAAVKVADGLTADAADVDNNITRLNIIAGNVSDGAAEVVTLAGQIFALNADKIVTASVGGTTLNLAYTASNRTFAITNNAGATTTIPEANLDTLLRGIAYENTSKNPTAGNRTFSFRATDANGLISTTAVSTINVIPVNDPPVIDLDANDSSGATGANYQTTFNKNGSAVPIADTDTLITDPDNTNLTSATITLTNRQTSDVLAAGTLPTGITASAYNATTGVITLTGSASLANYQTAIRAITFNNTSSNLSTTPRSVNVVVNDGSANSNTATTTININTPPVIDLDGNDSSGATGNNYQNKFSFNGSAVTIADADTIITDADDTNIESATITLTNRPNGTSETLSVLGTLPTGITASAYNSNTGVITLSGSATLANYQTAISQITYNNGAGVAGRITGDRTVNVVVNDGNADSNTAISTISVSLLNNSAPSIDLDGNDSSGATGNNYQTTFTEKGSAVAIADTDITITDADDTNIESATITLINAQASDLLAAGSLPAGIIASAYNATTGVITLKGGASLANYQTAIRAITFNNTSNNPNTTARNISVVVNDGNNNSNTATTTVNVIPVNDPPVLDLDGNDSSGATGANYLTTFTEKGSAVSIGDTDVSITDPDNTNIASAKITLTNAQASDLLAAGTLPAGITASAYNSSTGVITLTGSATLANYQTAIRAITFNNTSNNPNTTPRKVDVVVNDGTANSNTATTTVNVIPVNDPPVLDLDGNDSSGATGANYRTAFAKTGSAVSIADRDVSITDPDNTNIASATITLTNPQASDILAAGTLPAGITASAYNSNTGVITLTGSASLANYQTAIRAITFNSGNASTTPRTVNVVVNDGTANSNTATTTISIFDLLKGTNSPDTLTGGAGNDLIIAGKGEDILTGGAGDDIYFFNETSEGVDTITDFAKGQDKIDISNILANEVKYKGLDPFADKTVKLVSFNHPTLGASTIVQIDFDPADAVYPKDIAFLEKVTGVTATDFIF